MPPRPRATEPADQPIDLEVIRQEAYAAGYKQGHDDATAKPALPLFEAAKALVDPELTGDAFVAALDLLQLERKEWLRASDRSLLAAMHTRERQMERRRVEYAQRDGQPMIKPPPSPTRTSSAEGPRAATDYELIT